MLNKALLAAGVVLVLGATAFATGGRDPNSYLTYSLLALCAFGFKLADGSSMGFVFIIFALHQLGWGETLLIANSALFIQAVASRQKTSPEILLRSLAITSAAILITQAWYHAQFLARLQEPVRLMMAAGVCFVVLHAWKWRKSEMWMFPYYPVAAAIAAVCPVPLVLIPALFLTWRSYSLYERRLQKQRELSRAAGALHLRTIEALALAIEAKDQPLTGRSPRVKIYTQEMAKAMHLPTHEMEALRTAALLYDIGELAIPEHVTSRPGALTPEEFEKVKIHPTVGADILEQVRFPYPVAPIVRAHHERWDGAGYPLGLIGEQIPIGARILAAIDAVDALTSTRAYRPAVPLKDAIQYVSAAAGSAYDPAVIKLLRRNYRQWERIVTAQNSGRPVEPIFSVRREAQVQTNLKEHLSSSLDLEKTFEPLKAGVRSLVDFESLVVWVAREGHLEPLHTAGDHLAVWSSLRIPLGFGVSGAAVLNGKPVVNGEAPLEMAHVGQNHRKFPLKFALAIPFQASGVSGVLTLYRKGTNRFAPEDVKALAAVTPKLAIAVANGQKFSRANSEAETDALTGLPNAGALFQRLRLPQSACAVLVCDLDGFKHVNDTYGHLVGNRILVEVADGFRSSCRGADFVARMGGDEFVLLVADIAKADIGARVSQFREAVRAAGRKVCSGQDILDASFGAAFYPEDGTTPEELLSEADRNMYRRKQEQKNGVLRMERPA